jgi:hypothetical protein
VIAGFASIPFSAASSAFNNWISSMPMMSSAGNRWVKFPNYELKNFCWISPRHKRIRKSLTINAPFPKFPSSSQLQPHIIHEILLKRNLPLTSPTSIVLSIPIPSHNGDFVLDSMHFCHLNLNESLDIQ